jgi:hypothetical protein
MTTQTTSVPNVDLNDGNRMPQLGFGVFQVPAEETTEAVSHALRTGYRSIDTAAAYANEDGVREAIRESGLERGDVFVTTKLSNDSHGRDEAQRAFAQSLSMLGSSTPPASCRRSTRSSCTRTSSSPICGVSMPSGASRPRRGARSDRARCSTTR